MLPSRSGLGRPRTGHSGEIVAAQRKSFVHVERWRIAVAANSRANLAKWGFPGVPMAKASDDFEIGCRSEALLNSGHRSCMKSATALRTLSAKRS